MTASDSEEVRLLREEIQWLRQELARVQALVPDQKRSQRVSLRIEEAQTSRLTDSYLRLLQLDTVPEKARAESLSLREWEVLRLIGQGHSNKEIAREMQLGYSTVKNYVSSILKKLQLDGRTQIALLAHQWSGNFRLPIHRKMK